jgi:uncharacterized spore protein YtfJ
MAVFFRRADSGPGISEVTSVTGDSASSSHFFGRISGAIHQVVRASSVFGAPVERDGVTVIPVARALIGFGGGGDERHRAEGGGAGGFISPMGFIEMTPWESYRFLLSFFC